MAIPLTCVCGVHLEIDDKFAGKTIPCPDCERSLHVVPPQLASHQRLSGLAVASLVVALAGLFTLVGSIAAVALGWLARQDILRRPKEVDGLPYAHAGMVVGGAGVFLALAAFTSGGFLGVDSLLREFRWAGKLNYTLEPDGTMKGENQHNSLHLTPPPGRWGKLKLGEVNAKTDRLILFDLVQDAHLVVIPIMGVDEDKQVARDRAVNKFLDSDLVRILSRPGERAASGPEPVQTATDDPDEVILDLRLGGLDRTFLIRVLNKGADSFVLAGGTRSSRFERLKEDLRKSLASLKLEL